MPKMNATIRNLMIAAPEDFKNQEIVKLSCRWKYAVNFNYVNVPKVLNPAFEFKHGFQGAANYYTQNFGSRYSLPLTGGRKILIQLESQEFQNLEGFVTEHSRFINSYVSSTDSGDPLYTEIVIAWASPFYKIVRKVKLGNNLHILKLVATFVLSIELLFAMWGRFKKSAQRGKHEENGPWRISVEL